SVIIKILIAQQSVLISDETICRDFRGIEFNLKFHILRDGKQCSTKLAYQHLLGFLNVVDIGIVTITLISEDFHFRILVITHSEAKHREVNVLLTLFFYETFHCGITGFAHIEISIRCQDNSVITTFNEILVCYPVSKTNAFSPGSRTTRFQPFKRIKTGSLVTPLR